MNAQEKWIKSNWSKYSGNWPCPRCGNNKDRRAKHCRLCNNELLRGSSHSAYKNGRHINPDGYVRVLNPDPKREHKDRYVLEHRLLMEQELGRKLKPFENVHHLNGVRDDNRLDNLELWVTYQPIGQRVSDMVEWAHNILDLYEGA